MNTQELTAALQAKAASMPVMDLSLKLDFKGDGIIHIESKGTTTVVTNNDLDADCVITIAQSDFQKLMKGDLNPMMAMMSGKLKIKGDMGVAMKLQSIFK
jgi:putative sterol carrier protein